MEEDIHPETSENEKADYPKYNLEGLMEEGTNCKYLYQQRLDEYLNKPKADFSEICISKYN